MIDLRKIPTKPGIYIYRDTAGEIIYIGKAINLKKRVSQYFNSDDALGPKTSALVPQIASIQTKVVDSEIAALIMEAAFIKKYKPKFNSALKDGRSYSYICITKEKLPRVFTVFESTKYENASFYGPFPHGRSVQILLKSLKRLFPYYGLKKHPPRHCLYCHIGMCPGPSPDSKNYRQNILKIKKVLTGKFKSLRRDLNREMLLSSKNQEFEKALIARDQLTSLDYVVSGWRNLSEFYEKINLPEDRYSAAVDELVTTLRPYLPIDKISRIECFDISQMGTKHFVGSMVVFQDGRIDKSEYRKFKIYTKLTQDDQFMMKEVLWRRLRHPEWRSPDLIVVDGGKPQVSAANSIFANSSISDNQTSSISSLSNIPIIGLAKKFETIVIKMGCDWQEINLPARSHALHLLQSLRDEAHRFANRYRKELMKKSISL